MHAVICALKDAAASLPEEPALSEGCAQGQHPQGATACACVYDASQAGLPTHPPTHLGV